MKTIEFNIGTFNNTLEVQEIMDRIATSPTCDKFELGITMDGKWEDATEPTAYIRIQSGLSRVSTLLAWVEDLCVVMDQTAIAVKIDGVGYLVYDYRKPPSVERVPFDEQYFVSPKKLR